MKFAVIGSIGEDTFTRLRGHTVVTTDHPADKAAATAAGQAGLTTVILGAAWRVMDHPLSLEETRLSDDGQPHMFNKNGGYVRDAQMAEQVAAILIGGDVTSRRLEIILAAAKEHDVPVRYITPPAPAKTSRAEAETILAELGFEAQTMPF